MATQRSGGLQRAVRAADQILLHAAARAQERVLSGLPRASRTGFLDMLETFLADHAALIDTDEVLATQPPADPPKAPTTPFRRRGGRAPVE